MLTAIEVRAQTAQAGLEAVERQVPYALSVACNKTASAIARAVRAHVQSAFVLRQPRYMLASIMVLRFADKKQGNILPTGKNTGPRAAEVAVPDLPRGVIGAAVGLHPNPLGPNLQRHEPILARFETGRPKTGGVAIPTAPADGRPGLRPTFADQVPRQFYPKNLGLEARRLISGGMGPSTNKFGAFVLGQPGEKRYGIYARMPITGDWGDTYVRKGKRAGLTRKETKRHKNAPTKLVKLWHLKASVPIPARLNFYATARVHMAAFRDTFLVELRKALRTARSQGQTPSNRWDQPESLPEDS